MPIRRGPGLIRTAARTAAIAGTATAVSGRVARRQDEKYAEKDAQASAQQPASPEPATPAAETDVVAKLKELAELHAAGALDDAEFEAAKAQILGS